MVHLTLLTILFTACSSGAGVYVCTVPQSECYHKKKSCRGLKSCSEDIRQMAVDEANAMGRRPCSYCYKGK